MKDILEKIYNEEENIFYSILEDLLTTNKKKFIITVNPEIIMKSYKNIENVSAEQYRSFCKMFTSALVSVSLSEFNSSISSLDFKSRDLLLRGIEYSSKEFSSLDLSNYSKLL